MSDSIVVRWTLPENGVEAGFYSEMDFLLCWSAMERLRAGIAEYESWRWLECSAALL